MNLHKEIFGKSSKMKRMFSVMIMLAILISNISFPAIVHADSGNLLEGKLPSKVYYAQKGAPSVPLDGNEMITDTDSATKWTSGDHSSEATLSGGTATGEKVDFVIVYDLGEEKDIAQASIKGGNGWEGPAVYITGYDVYVGKDEASMFDSPAATVTGGTEETLTVATNAKGRYIAFVITAPDDGTPGNTGEFARIMGLWAYSEAVLPVTDLGGSYLAGKKPVQVYRADKGAPGVARNGETMITDDDTMTKWTNGANDGEGTLTGGTDGDTKLDFVIIYDLGSEKEIGEVNITGGNGWEGPAVYITGFDVYAANNLDSLFDAKVAEVRDSTAETVKVPLSSPVKAQYLAFVITNPDDGTPGNSGEFARLLEIEAYKEVEIVIEDEPLAEIGTTSEGENLVGKAAAEFSQKDGKTTIIYDLTNRYAITQMALSYADGTFRPFSVFCGNTKASLLLADKKGEYTYRRDEVLENAGAEWTKDYINSDLYRYVAFVIDGEVTQDAFTTSIKAENEDKSSLMYGLMPIKTGVLFKEDLDNPEYKNKLNLAAHVDFSGAEKMTDGFAIRSFGEVASYNMGGDDGYGNKYEDYQTAIVISYDLGKNYDVSEISFINGSETYNGAPKGNPEGNIVAPFNTDGIEIYASKSKYFNIEKDSLVFSQRTGLASQSEIKANVTVNQPIRYITYIIFSPHAEEVRGWGFIRIAELRAYGTESADQSVEPLDEVVEEYVDPNVVSTISDNKSGIAIEVMKLTENDVSPPAMVLVAKELGTTEISSVVSAVASGYYADFAYKLSIEAPVVGGAVDIGGRALRILIPYTEGAKLLFGSESSLTDITAKATVADGMYVLENAELGVYVVAKDGSVESVETSTETSAENKNEEKGGNTALIVVIIAIAVLAVGACGFLFFKKKKNGAEK